MSDAHATSAQQDRSLRFGVLGPLEVLGSDGRRRTLGGPRQRAVLAHLLIRSGQVVPTEVLVDQVWGEDAPGSARAIIQTYVSHLRAALGAQRIAYQPPGYRLDISADELDSTTFASLMGEATSLMGADPGRALNLLDEALGMWRGPAFADIAIEDAIAPHAARLDEERVGAQERRVEALLALGAPARAIEAAERSLADHPYHEHLWELLMLALYRAGRQRDALDAFHRIRRALDRELGVEPSPQLAELQRRILRQDVGLIGPPAVVRGYRIVGAREAGRLGARSLAIDGRTGREVVIEEVRPTLLVTPGFVRRFDTATRSALRLEHPSICPVVDAWRDDAGAWVVTGVDEGRSLREVLEVGAAVPPTVAARIVESMGAAIDGAHAAGVVHGAVSGERVRVDDEGHAVITGFWMGDGPRPSPADDVDVLVAIARQLVPDLGFERRPMDGREVATAVRQALGLETRDPLTQAPERNPYKGLRPFGEADLADFHGRERLVQRVIERLGEAGTDARFLAVVGPSGAGKSSLLAAGVIPAVRSGRLWPRDRTWIVTMSPGDHPCEALETALRSATARPDRALRAFRAGGMSGLRDALDRGMPRGAGCLLVIDRFEDLFLDGPDPSGQERFLGLLGHAMTGRWDRLAVLVAIRADRYDLPLRHVALGGLVAARTEPVPPLSPDGLESAIRGPADAVGVGLGPGLLATIVGDAVHQAGSQPLLQYALTELFERRTDGSMTLDAYHAMDGLIGALTSSADALLATFDPRQRRIAREILLRLVTVGEGPPRVRQGVRRSDLTRWGIPSADIDDVVELFGRHRLLTSDRDAATREPTVELAHEALITGWRTLGTWIAEATDDLRREQAVGRAATEWSSSGRDASFLLRGHRLEQVEAWAAQTDLTLSNDERELLEASIERRAEERLEAARLADRESRLERTGRQRLRVLVAILVVLIAVAGSAAAIADREAGRSRQMTRLAEIRELAAASIASVEQDPERGLLLAREAVAMAEDAHLPVPAEVEQALHDSLAASRPALTLDGVAGQVAWGPDGGVIATGSDPTGTLSLRDGASGGALEQVITGAVIEDVAVSPDGAAVAVALEDGALVVLSSAGLQERFRVIGSGPAWGVSWGSSERVSAVWPDEAVVRVVDATGGRVIARLERHEAVDTALSPDDRSIAIAGGDATVVDLATVQGRPRHLVPVASLSGVAYPVGEVAWSPDGRWIGTASMSGVDLWDAATARHAGHLEGHQAGVETLAWSNDSRSLVTGGGDGTVRGWEVTPEGARHSWTMRARAIQGGVRDVALDAAASRVLAAGPGGAVMWSLARPDDRDATVIDAVGFFGDVAFLPGDTTVVGVGRGGRTSVWGTAGRIERTLGPPLAEHWFDVSPDGTAIAIGSGGRTIVMDLESGATRFVPEDVGAELDWSPEGDELAIGRSILDVSGGVVGTLDLGGYEVREPRYSPDGRFIITSGDTIDGPRIIIWDRRTRRPIRMLDTPSMDVAIDPSGTLLATDGTPSGRPMLWELATGRPLRSLGDTSVLDVAFSPDGTRVATAGSDGLVRLYDVATGAEVLTLHGHRDVVRAVAFDSTGQRLASQSPGEIRIWTLDLGALVERAASEATRRLSDEECLRVLRRACVASD